MRLGPKAKKTASRAAFTRKNDAFLIEGKNEKWC